MGITQFLPTFSLRIPPNNHLFGPKGKEDTGIPPKIDNCFFFFSCFLYKNENNGILYNFSEFPFL